MITKLMTPILLLLAINTAGCTAIAVSQYDPITDTSVTSLQKETTTLLTDIAKTAGTPEGAYANYTPRYDQINTDLSSLKLRAEAIPNNDLTVQQLTTLQDQFDNLKLLHQGGLKPMELPLLQRAFDRTYGAILKLELAKRDMRQSTSTGAAKTPAAASTPTVEPTPPSEPIRPVPNLGTSVK